MEDSKYLKLFEKHADYITYINGNKKIFPNVSCCIDNDDVHYNLFTKIETKFNASADNISRFIYIDDFPDSVCETYYDGDMTTFKQDTIDNYEQSNKYVYTGEMLEYNNTEYYLWEYEPYDELYANDAVKYLITDTLDFTGQSLTDNINNDNVPFIARLTSDKQVYELGTDTDVPILVYYKSGIKLTNEIDEVSEIVIDGVKLPKVVQYYQFEDENEHTVTITFKNTRDIPPYAFFGCKGLQSIEIPNTTKKIWENAFEDSGISGELIIPDSVTSLDEDSFHGCVNLTKVTISQNVETIPDGCFQDCSGLTELTLHENIYAIGDSAFAGCSSLESITILANDIYGIGPDVFEDTNDCPIYVPAEYVEYYKSVFVDYSSRIQAIPSV